MHATETKATPEFRKTTETFKAGAKTLPQRYFVSPEIFAEEPSFAKPPSSCFGVPEATARQAGEEFCGTMAVGRTSESDREAGDYLFQPIISQPSSTRLR